MSVRRAVLAGVLVALCLLAFWVRLQFIVIYGGTQDYLAWAMKHYFGGITPFYLDRARELLEKGTYTALSYPPGYPAFIALMYAFDITEPQTLRVVQVAFDSSSSIAFFFLLRAARVPTATALMGPLTYAVYPLWAAGSTFLLAESLSPALLLWSMAALVYVRRSSGWRGWLLAGLVLGLVSLVRPDFLLLIGVGFVWALVAAQPPERFRTAASLVAGFAVVIGAWGLHNRVEHDAWVFSTTGGGVGLWEGLGDLPNEYGYVLSDEYAIRLVQAKGMQWHSVEADRYFKSEYARAWLEHPDFVLKVIGYRWQKIIWTSDGFQPGLLDWLKRLLDKYGIWLALAAAILSWRNPVALLLIVTPVVYALVSIGLVHWEPRYVRYVHLGYLSAAIILVSQTTAVIPSVRRLALGRVYVAVIGLAAAGVAGLELRVLHEVRISKEFEALLPKQHSEGKLVPGPHMRALSWRPEGEARVDFGPNGIGVETTGGPYTYQVVAKLPVEAKHGMLVRYVLDIYSGGAMVGVLDQHGQWLVVDPLVKPGINEGQVGFSTGRNKEVSIVLANHNERGTSAFVVRNLETWFTKAPQSDLLRLR